MSTTDANYVELWGRILLHNKLMTQAEWIDIQIAYGKGGGKIPIEQVLLKKSKLSKEQLGVIAGKIHAVIQSHSHDEDPTPDHADHAAAKATLAAHAPVDDDDGDDDELVEVAESDTEEFVDAEPVMVDDDDADDNADEAVPVAVTDNDGTTDEDGDDDEEVFEITSDDYDTNDGDDDADDIIDRGGEVDWAAEAGGEHPTLDTAQARREHGDIAQIDLDGDEDEYQAKDEVTRLAKLHKPETLADVKRAAQEMRSDLGLPESEIIPCDVTPGAFDETAVKLLQQAVQSGASDVHLSAGSPPFMRLHGKLVFFKMDTLTPNQTHRMVLSFMDARQQQHYLKHLDLDFSLEDETLGRFRVNALKQFRGPSIIFRIIPAEVPSLKSLGLPATIGRFTQFNQGLVLVTGSAGCGKSTTAAALINMVNHDRRDHVITVEDPVEFIHVPDLCNVTQRQVPRDTESFATALRAALREDPDVIMIGEMRDLETVSLAIRAAETGHLVIGTLQTRSATRTIDRVIDVFPEDQQPQIRSMLSESLRGVISQQLIPRADGNGRVVALEILTVTGAVSNLIRDAKTYQLPSLMQTGSKAGMVVMQDSIDNLVKAGVITQEEGVKAMTF